MRIAVGGDHAGFEMKRDLMPILRALGHTVDDLGTHSPAAVDYPDCAESVAGALRDGRADRGLIVCGSGAGVSIAANKFPGDPRRRLPRHLHGASGRRARRHERPLPRRPSHRHRAGHGDRDRIPRRDIFREERHQRRLNKILAIESRFARS